MVTASPTAAVDTGNGVTHRHWGNTTASMTSEFNATVRYAPTTQWNSTDAETNSTSYKAAVEYITEMLTTKTTQLTTDVFNVIANGSSDASIQNDTTDTTNITTNPVSPTSSPTTTTQGHVAKVFSEIDEFTGMHNFLSPHGNNSSSTQSLAPLGLLVIIFLSLSGNAFLLLAVRLDRRLRHMTYYFLVSLASVHILMTAVVMPPAVLVIVTGSFTYSEDICKLWVTLDLFFCNNTSLHLAFTNMDTFLRLKDPLRRGRDSTTCSVVLWIGASWVISLVQGIAQFMLSQADHNIVPGGICFIPDKNFVILGTLFSFVIPTLISMTFYGMCLGEIRGLRTGKYLEELEDATSVGHNMFRYNSNESLADELSDSTSCLSDGNEEEEAGVQASHERVQLALVTNISSEPTRGSADSRRGCAASGENTTSFCEDSISPSLNNGHAYHDHHGDISHNSEGHANSAFSDHIVSISDQTSSCTLLLRDAETGHERRHLAGNSVTNHNADVRNSRLEHQHICPDETLRQEIAISRLMFLLLLFLITLWIPYSAGNIVYGVCQHCRRNMTFDEIMTFKWLAYASGIVSPLVCIKFSEPLREAIWSLLLCRYCRWQQ